MNNLNWRIARNLELTERLIPNPASQSEKLSNLANVPVALDGAFLYIDPRQEGQPDLNPTDTEFDVYVVPASAVRVVTFKDAKPAKGAPRVRFIQ